MATTNKSRSIFSVFLMVTLFMSSLDAFAYRADRFKGWYPILSRTDKANEPADPRQKEYMLLDVDTLENIWTKYGDGKLPPDLVPIRGEPSIIVGFTNRKTLFLTLEKNVMQNDTYLAIRSSNGNTFEISLRADGNADMAVRDNNQVSIYLLGPHAPSPSFWREFSGNPLKSLNLSGVSVNY